MEQDQQQAQGELALIVSLLEEITGRRSRWNGVVELSDDLSVFGKADWNGTVVIARTLIGQDLRWRTQIHEALHTLSSGLNHHDYFDLRGWEEGVVEQLQRILRPRIFQRLNIEIGESVFEQMESEHRFNPYNDALERLRQALNQPQEKYYLSLLAEPLKERPAFLIQLAKTLPRASFLLFQRQFALDNSVLTRRIFP